MTITILTRRLLLATALAWPLASQPISAQQGEPVLRVVAPWEYTSNDPTDTGFILARMGIGETLVQVEPEGQLIGGVAESWRVSEDKLSWRFKLRAGASFHDGSPVTADAVAAALGVGLLERPVLSKCVLHLARIGALACDALHLRLRQLILEYLKVLLDAVRHAATPVKRRSDVDAHNHVGFRGENHVLALV